MAPTTTRPTHGGDCVCVCRFFSLLLFAPIDIKRDAREHLSFLLPFFDTTVAITETVSYVVSFSPLFFFAFVVWGFFFLSPCSFFIYFLPLHCCTALRTIHQYDCKKRRRDTAPFHPAVPFWRSNALPPPPLISYFFSTSTRIAFLTLHLSLRR